MDASTLRLSWRPAQCRSNMVAESLLFELEIRDDGAEIPRCVGNDLSALEDHVALLAAPQTLFESRLLCDIRQFKAAVLAEEGRHDIVVLATKLAVVGYQVSIRTAVGGGAGQECFRNLHHEFLVIASDSGDLIVEPQFRAQFCISTSTRNYEDLMQSLPEEWVGSKSRIKPLVRLLCTQMALAFDAAQTSCPPWRQQKSVISKWLPIKKWDRDVSAGIASPRSGSSPTSTLTSPDTAQSPPSPAAHSSKLWSPPRTRADSFTWHISSAVLQAEPQATAEAPQPAPSQTGSSPVRSRQSKQKSALEPQSSTKGFLVRHSAPPAQPSHHPPPVFGPRVSELSRSSSQKPSPLLQQQAPACPAPQRLVGARPAAPWQGAPAKGQGQGQSAGEGSQLVPLLGLARQSASTSAYRSTRHDLWQQPPIHTVRLGRAQPAH